MHALVVYESMYGNTKEIAEAVAEGLAARMPAEVVEVGSAPPPWGRRCDCSWSEGPRTPFP
jgi:flavodoxin